MITSGRRTSAPDDLRPTAHRRSSVAELLRLHGLALPAVRNRVGQEVGADGIHVHQVIASVGGDVPVSVDAPELPLLDLVDAPFFFQAEDGIRDKLVTGVQTCALPI